MIRRYYSLFCLAALMMLAGCVKESESDGRGIPEGALELVAESSNAPGSKVWVSGEMVFWSANEPVNVNGKELSIVTARVEGGANTAYIDGVDAVESGKHYFVWTPVNMVKNVSELESQYGNSTGRLNATLPSEYVYEKERGHQKISGLPMFGVVEAGSSQKVFMKHLSAAVSVNVTNSTPLPVLMDSIVVSCKNPSGNVIQLSGLNRYNIQTCEPNYQASSSRKGVKMNFTTTATSAANRRLAAGAEMKVQVPIMPILSGKNAVLTVKVYFHVDWDAAIAGDAGIAAWKNASYRSDDTLFCREQSTSNTSSVYTNGIARNQLVNAPMEITMDDAKLKRGLFKIGDNMLGAVTNGSIGGSGRKLTSTEMRYLLASQDVLKSLNMTEYVSGSSYSGVNYTNTIQVNMLCVDPNNADNIDNGSFQAEWYRYTVTRPDNGEPDRTNSIFYAYEFEDNVVLYPDVYEVSGWYTVNSGGPYTWSRPLSWGTPSSVGSNGVHHNYTYNTGDANFYVYVVE